MMIAANGAGVDRARHQGHPTWVTGASSSISGSQAATAVSVTALVGLGRGNAVKPVGVISFGLSRSGKQVITERQTLPNNAPPFARRPWHMPSK
jgi:nicotinamide-nucleotide amidase